jgi:hypothetical protein
MVSEGHSEHEEAGHTVKSSREVFMERAGRSALSFLAGAVLAALLTPACGSGPASPSAAPDVRGTYTGNAAWITNVAYPQSDVSGTSATYACSGSITIDSQSGSAFSGTFSVEGQPSVCTGSGPLANGNVKGDGTLSFELPGPQGGPHPGTERWSEACSLASDSVAYSGSMHGSDLEAARSLRYSCPKAGPVLVSVSFSGRR